MRKLYSVFYLFAANMFGIVITVVCLPVLAARYTPEQFGTWSVVLSISSFMAIAGTLQLEPFIPACRYRFQAQQLVGGIRRMVALACGAFTLCGLTIAFIAGRMDWAQMVTICALMTAAIALNQMLQFVLTRKTAYHMLANRQLFLGGVKVLLQLALSFRSNMLLINGLVAGELITRITQLLVTDRGSLAIVTRGGKKLPWLYCLRPRWRAKGLHAVTSRLLSDGGILLTPLIVTFLYGTNASGQFAIAFTAVLSVINATLMTANSMLMGEAAHHYHDERPRFRLQVLRVLSVMCLAGVGMYVFSLFFARPIIDLLFHDGWDKVYGYFMFLLPIHSLTLAFGMTGTALTLMHKPQYTLYASMLWHAILWPFVAYCFVMSAGMETFLFGLSIAIVARYLCNFFAVLYWLFR